MFFIVIMKADALQHLPHVHCRLRVAVMIIIKSRSRVSELFFFPPLSALNKQIVLQGTLRGRFCRLSVLRLRSRREKLQHPGQLLPPVMKPSRALKAGLSGAQFRNKTAEMRTVEHAYRALH